MRRSTYFISDEFFLEFIVPKKSSFFRFSIFCNATTILTKYKSRLFDLYHSCNHFYETLHCRKSISATCDQVFCCVVQKSNFSSIPNISQILINEQSQLHGISLQFFLKKVSPFFGCLILTMYHSSIQALLVII